MVRVAVKMAARTPLWLLLTSIVCWGAQAAPADVSSTTNKSHNTQCQSWEQFDAFKQTFINKDGRVVDSATEFKYSTSEGQSYALFFALIANDQQLFEKVFNWTENNLADGDLTATLPAWQWGKRKDDSWGVVDENSASDSDLWISYVLLEAGRLWNIPRFTALGKLLAQRILREETAILPKLGLTLLPAPIGFTPDKNSWRLNPSYVPIVLLRALYQHTQNPQWQALIESSEQLIIQSAKNGYPPDWIVYHKQKGFIHQGEKMSYNAIRVYLWAGMMHQDDPLRQPQLNQLSPILEHLTKQGVPPLNVDIVTNIADGIAPGGFSAALLPFLAVSDNASALLKQQQLRLIAHPLSEKPEQYYQQVLGVFALGWMNKLYRFGPDGQLLVNWDSLCPG